MRYKAYTLNEICSVVTDYVANGSFKSLADNVNYLNEKNYARLIRLVDRNNNYDESNAIWVDESSYNFLRKSSLFGDEIIISNVGANLGTVFLCPKLNYPMTLGPNSVILKTNDLCDQIYLYYYLSSKVGYSKLMSIVSGSAMPKFNKTDLKKIEIELPEKDYQLKAVKILKKIDNKIELNNEINNNLYDIASGLINEAFINDERIKLSELIKFVKGKKPSDISEDYKEGYEKYLTIACLNNQENMYADPTKTLLTESDILMVMDGASSGDVYFSDKGIVGSTLSKIEICNEKYTPEYVFFTLKRLVKVIQEKTTGSAIPHTDKVYVGNLEIPKLDMEEQLKYKSLIAKIIGNNKQNITLIKLRDVLLPKLMNGEIDLDNIEI